ncbi:MULTISPECIES: TRAP transporter small permease [Halomonas]|uniref:TRAP transporter small permease protein n=1 Tax=Vreelandella aquamarina TaxID=77097 RepID=A0A6F8SZH7_9GAMM|nr:TRAP transporter small permease [Halomonas meridiana]MCO7243858.1 TRAP transporter small permease [Halomonas sp. Ps84H-12]BCA93142.1 C4-dicarboxylate ABC transporter permease [Halomonas meridiana]
MEDAVAPSKGLDRMAFYTLRSVTRLCDGVGVALMATILLLIVAAVIARDLLGLGMPWTEEVASLLAIYAIGFGSLSAWVRSEHLVVDLFSHKLSGLGKNIQYRVTTLISCGFFALAAWGAWIMSDVSANNKTVSLSISFSYLYYGIFFSFMGMALIALWQCLRGPVAWLEAPREEEPTQP